VKPDTDRLMARLSAADPALDLKIDSTTRNETWQHVLANRGTPGVTRARANWRMRRRSFVIALVGVLLMAAGALAAGGVIPIGKPAQTVGPDTSLSALRSGEVIEGTAHLLPISAPDPVTGPPWGMRIYRKKLGEGCVQLGRLVDGKLGAIGQDNAFADDGLFHEFTAETFGAQTACNLLDASGHLLINATVGDLPASAWEGVVNDRCVPSTAAREERYEEGDIREPYTVCPQADERDIYYGLLGSEAKGITYLIDGRRHTQVTVGPEGAYLLITTASPTQLFNSSAGGTQDVVPVDGPITELHYRDGATCHLTSRSWIGGKESCGPALSLPLGWIPSKTSAPTAAQITAPLHLRVVSVKRGGYEGVLRFTSRIAIDNARGSYWVQWHEAGQPPKVRTLGRPLPTFPAAGETETMRMGHGLRHGLHRGLLTGEVIYRNQAGPGNVEETGRMVRHTVGRFKISVP
jgi:hypothetical protein